MARFTFFEPYSMFGDFSFFGTPSDAEVQGDGALGGNGSSFTVGDISSGRTTTYFGSFFSKATEVRDGTITSMFS